MATQQEINDFVEQIIPYFDPTPVEDDAVQQSWPRLDRGLSDVQDMVRFQHLSGIFGRGGQPYWLRNNGTENNTNATNQMRLTVSTITGTAEATIRGAFHRLRSDVLLDFPAVSSPTLQHVVLEYDPVRSEDGGDPIEAKVVTSMSGSQGKEYLRLWAVDRRPSQLLTDAPIQQYRPFVSSSTTYNYSSHLPDPAELLSGTIAYATHDSTRWMSLQGNELAEDGTTSAVARWVDLTNPAWTDRVAYTYKRASIGEHPGSARVGRQVFLRGVVAPAWDGNFTLNQNNGAGYMVMLLPANQRPSRIRYFTCAVSGATGQLGFARVEINNSGEVRVRVSKESSWVSLDGISFHTE